MSAQLRYQVMDMISHRVGAQMELTSEVLICETTGGHELEHLTFRSVKS